ncbi:hypothetical protein [Vibrio phage vB_VpS_CA8]|nr:hypothetical protein [Vibrio phage vB_VpS_CA8]QEQ95157.1 hypothetical protein [Vibrio phage vB_VpS_BA3]UFK27017.1 hypothetical protein [Vibrio phage vB_VpaS_AL-2]
MSRITKNDLEIAIDNINRLLALKNSDTRFQRGAENGMHHVKEFVNGQYRCNRSVGTAREVHTWLCGVQYGLTA